MEKVICGDSHYWIDGILKKNLDIARAMVKDDWDGLWVIDGNVGSGKSVFAQQVAYYISEGKFNLDNICFTHHQFKKAILSAGKYEAIVFDEAFRGLAGRGAMSKTNRQVVELLNEIRQKNLFVFIVLPSMWDLDKHVTMFRARGVFNVYAIRQKKEDGTVKLKRGYAKFYKGSTIQYFIGNSKNKYVYPKEHTFRVTFRNHYPVDEQAYKDKKLGALDSGKIEPKESIMHRKRKEIVTNYIKHLRNDYSDTEIAEIGGHSRKFLRNCAGPRAEASFQDPQSGRGLPPK